MTLNKTYVEGRDLIQNGDIINIYRPSGCSLKTPLYLVINFFTGSKIYHNVVAMWMSSPSGEKRLMAVESNLAGGKRIIPLSVYFDLGRKLEVMPKPESLDFNAMEPELMARVAEQKYSLLDFISIGAREFFGMKQVKDYNGQVCSELCAGAWMSAGFPLESSLISPGMLKQVLMKNGVEPSFTMEKS